MRRLRNVILALFGLLVIALGILKWMYGGGTPSQYVATEPLRTDLTTPIQIKLPPGMVAAGPDGRIFFTYHPLFKPERATDAVIFEWTGNTQRPIGEGLGAQLHGTFGITVDARGWLWGVRPAGLERDATDVYAIDPDSGEIKYSFEFAPGDGLVAQDLRVSVDGRYVYFADTGLLNFTSAALIVLDTQTGTYRTLLEDHDSTAPQNWVMRKTDGRNYRVAFGLLTFQVGVDGLVLTADGQWLIYATMTHDGVFRVPTAVLTDPDATDGMIEGAVEHIGPGPMSDGIDLDAQGRVIITDVENGGLARLSDGTVQTLVSDDRVDWADSVAVAPNGDIWFTDSRLTALLDQFLQPPNIETLIESGPYWIYQLPPEAQ